MCFLKLPAFMGYLIFLTFSCIDADNPTRPLNRISAPDLVGRAFTAFFADAFAQIGLLNSISGDIFQWIFNNK